MTRKEIDFSAKMSWNIEIEGCTELDQSYPRSQVFPLSIFIAKNEKLKKNWTVERPGNEATLLQLYLLRNVDFKS